MKDTSRRKPGSRPPARPAPLSSVSAATSVAASAAAAGPAGSVPLPSQASIHAAKARAALATIGYIALPGQIAREFGGFTLEAGVPLPVQIQPGEKGFDLSKLSAEAIVTGMLRVLAWNPSDGNADYYRRFIKAVKPGLLEELSTAGVQKAQAKEWEVAEEIFLALAGLHPERPEPLLDLAFLYEDRSALLMQEAREDEAENEDEAAHSIYRRLLAEEPPFPLAFYHAALFFLKRRNFDRAVSLLTTYVGMDDDEARIGRAREVLKKLNESGYLDTLFKEAYDFIRMGEEERGLEKAREFTERYPTVWNGWFLVGWACRRLERWEEGREAFLKAVSLGADEADTFNELSICQTELGDLTGARRSLERALRAEPENVKIMANLGALSFRQGRKGEAAGFFRSALDLDPDDAVAAEWLKRLESEGGE